MPALERTALPHLLGRAVSIKLRSRWPQYDSSEIRPGGQTMHEPEIAFHEEPDPSVRWRAWRMWLAAGSPQGREREYLNWARELTGRG